MKFGKYKTYTEFLRDTSVTKERLIDLIVNYETKACTYVPRHPNFTPDIFEYMFKHELWYVRMVGYFHHYFGENTILERAKNLVRDKKEDKRILNRASLLIEAIENQK